MSPTCPRCNKALPESVVKGPPRAVIKCDGCKADLLWFEGRAVPKSSTTAPRPAATMAGKPPAPPKKPEPKSVDDSTAKMPAMDEQKLAEATKKPAATMLGMPGAKKPEPPKRATEYSVKKPETVTAPKKPTPTGSKTPDKKIGSFPLPAEKSGPVKSGPVATKPAEKSGPVATRPPEKSGSIVSKPAPVVNAPGPMVDPKGWFNEAKPAKAEPAELPPPPAELPVPQALEVPKAQMPIEDSQAGPLPVQPAANVAVGGDIPGAEHATDVLQSEDLLSSDETSPQGPTLVNEPKQSAPEPATEPGPALAELAAARSQPVAPPPAAPTPPPATESLRGELAPVESARAFSGKKIAILGAAAAVVVIGVVAFGRGSKPAAKAAPTPIAKAPEPAPVAAVQPTPPAPEPTPPPPPVAPEPRPQAVAAVEKAPEVERPAPRHHSRETPAVADAPAERPSRHKTVLEYDPNPKQRENPITGPAPAGADPEVIEKAREAYHKGNWSLFIGNNVGAVDAYKETLRIYPGYIAGYRGLGLAYAELGKREQALEALQKYMSTVPNARDIPLIKKRIERLEKSDE